MQDLALSGETDCNIFGREPSKSGVQPTAMEEINIFAGKMILGKTSQKNKVQKYEYLWHFPVPKEAEILTS